VSVTGKRSEVLQHWMTLIERYTLNRAFHRLTQAEFDWEPHPGAWGVRRRERCLTPNPSGDRSGEWVCDQDWAAQMSAWPLNADGEPDEPMATIGWLLNHFGAAPGLTARMDFVGGSEVPTDEGYRRMWGYTVIPTVDEAVTRFRDGWAALGAALADATDEMLELDRDGHPWKRGDHAVAALLNEVSHHGTQICVLRDIYSRSRR
jgi:hypothetical protein